MGLPLCGVKVLDLSRLLPGPFCSMILADFGAEVLKVEDTELGDYLRYMPGMEAAYRTLNRNKQSLSINLKEPRGQEIFHRLATGADVLLEGFRPGVAGRLGIDYTSLKKLNSRLIYCSLTGYGQEGAGARKSGHDLNYIGLAGILGLTGPKNSPPAIPGVQIADIGGAMWAAVGILLALLAREKTGEGQFLDVAMLDGAIAWLPVAASGFLAGDPPPGRDESVLSGAYACYRVYETKDQKYISLGALEGKFWAVICRLLGRSGWVADQFAGECVQSEMIKDLEEIFRSRTREEWLDFFKEEDICLESVCDLAEVAADPRVKSRQMFVESDDQIKYLGIPVKLSATPGAIRTGAPKWGENSRDVLMRAGYGENEIMRFIGQGIIK